MKTFNQFKLSFLTLEKQENRYEIGLWKSQQKVLIPNTNVLYKNLVLKESQRLMKITIRNSLNHMIERCVTIEQQWCCVTLITVDYTLVLHGKYSNSGNVAVFEVIIPKLKKVKFCLVPCCLAVCLNLPTKYQNALHNLHFRNYQ